MTSPGVPPSVTPPSVTPPADTAPSVTPPAHTLPVSTASVDAAQVEIKPVDIAPVDTAPVDTAPVDTTPADTAVFVPLWSPRPGWAQAPTAVREWAESVLGSPVATARDVTGGFSSGIASRLTGTNGARLFVKAVHADLNPFSPRMLRHELRIGPGLAATGASAPVLRGGFEADGWVAAAFDEVDGTNPVWPWREDDAAAALAALAILHQALTPAPSLDVPPAAHSLRGDIAAWTRLEAASAEDLDHLDPWVLAHRDELATRATGIDLSGDTVLNLDVRADNIVIGADGAVWFVDWPWACTGPAAADVVVLLVNFAVAGLDPQTWLPRSHVADDQLVTDFLCLLVGMWSAASISPAPPGTQGIREFQRAHLVAATRWLRRRLAP